MRFSYPELMYNSNLVKQFTEVWVICYNLTWVRWNQTILPYLLLFPFAIPLLCHAALPEVPTQCFVRVSCSAAWEGDEALRQRVSQHGVRTERIAREKKRKKNGVLARVKQSCQQYRLIISKLRRRWQELYKLSWNIIKNRLPLNEVPPKS